MPDVSWNRVAGFVRQHTHDLRNELNGLDLEAALLSDIITDPEAVESLARLRSEIRKIALNLRSLSGKFAEPRPTFLRLPARELFLIWRDQLSGFEKPAEVEWQNALREEHVNVDPDAISQVFRELLVNAHAFHGEGPLRVFARAENGNAVFELHEPKVDVIDPGCWGQAPFETTGRGRYGLGLCSLTRAVEANGGSVSWKFASPEKELVTRLSFPVAD